VDFAVGTVDFAAAGGDGFQPLPPTGDSRKKKAVGKFVPACVRPSACLRGYVPTMETFAVDGFQPLPPIGDSRKKKRRWGNLCLLWTSNPFFAEEIPHPGKLTP
jgi:hypothetical protein